MTTTSEARSLPFFVDLFGQPLESGLIYIGQPGLDPQVYPQTVYSDVGNTVVLQQPIRTTHGHAVSGGSQVHMFCAVPYSIVIKDSSGRTVYASLNETDPVFSSLATSNVQSASSLADLRSRAGSSTNLVWVSAFGMYRYISTDTTSPEAIPFVIVGNDGSRYYLDNYGGNFSFARVNAASGAPNNPGMWLSWGDLVTGAGGITTNQGTGSGGLVIRNVNAANTIETGRVTVGGDGSVIATGQISTSGAHDIRSGGNLIAQGGTVAVLSDSSRALTWDAGNSRYSMPGAALAVNGSLAITQATLQAAILSNQQANGVGALALGTSGSPSPVLPGTWAATGTASNSVYLWVRVS